MDENNKLLMGVAFDDEKGAYKVHLAQGSSVKETAFCMNVIIRCLLRDNIIKSADEVLDEVRRYLSDVQWDEVKDDTDNNLGDDER